MKTVIMAGGKGTRISSIVSDIPKPLIRIKGKPVLEYEIDCLRRQGFTDIVITISHLGEKIIDYFGDGNRLGVNIEYFYEEIPLGNAGALFKIKKKLKEDFLLINADSIFDVDLKKFVAFHKRSGGLITIFTHPNSHPFDSSIILADQEGKVEHWLTKDDERPKWYKNRVNAGLHIISPIILDQELPTSKVDLDRQLLKPFAGTGKMFCYDSPEYIKDMGTPERFKRICRDLSSGIVNERNLNVKQKAIFMDRDGTINKYVGFLRDLDVFELLPGVATAIKNINNSGFLAIVVTNQPVIARGEVSYGQLNEIHNKMETLLGEQGAYLDAIYFCPHHPDSGFSGERIELKIDCDCRKPKSGMLRMASTDYNIDLSKSWMIGDDENDMRAGANALCSCVKIKENYSLLDAVKFIIKG